MSMLGGYGGYGMGAMPTHASTLNPLLGSTSAIPMAAPMMQAPMMQMQAPIMHQEQVVHRHVPVVHEQTVEVPHMQTQEVVRHVPVPIVQEREVQVAKIEYV